jgi:glucose/arabinose dehydrogenase
MLLGKRTLLGSLFALTGLAAAAGPACSTAGDDVDDGSSDYTTSGDCDGLPRLNLETPPGVCVGLAVQGPSTFVTPGTDLRFPRGIAELPNGDFILADMGGFSTNIGTIWRLHRNGRTFTKTLLNKQIDQPSGVVFNPGDGLVYIGTPDGVFRIDPNDTAKPPKVTVVISQMPSNLPNPGPDGKPVVGRHPLKHFVFDPKDPKIIYVNSGSGTDVCEQGTGASATFPLDCPELDDDPTPPERVATLDAAALQLRRQKRAGIRRYDLRDFDKQPLDAHGRHLPLTDQFRLVAKGLRNSMALAIHPTSGLLVQGENSRDAINKRDPKGSLDEDADLPNEELNVIGTMDELGATENPTHFGWPFCHSNGQANPEYEGRVDCTKFTNPALALPPHVAPLGMKFYTGSMFPDVYKNQLIVGYHGYRDDGHRLMMIPVDDQGRPGAGEPRDIIRNWIKKGNDPQGSPVDVLVAKDGSIYLTEDKNRTVLRVFFDRTKGDGNPLAQAPHKQHVPDPQEGPRCADMATRVAANDQFALIEKNILDVECAGCHGVGPGFPGNIPIKKCDDRNNAAVLKSLVTPGDPDNSRLMKILKGDGEPRMPSDGLEDPEIAAIGNWIKSLPR